MQEVLFRGIRKDNKQWVYGSYHYCNGIGIMDKVIWKDDGRDIVEESVVFNSHWILKHRTPIHEGWNEGNTYTPYDVIPESIGQYTNHKINEVNLYAGDILRNEKMDDYEDAVEYLVCTFIKEWAMFGLLTIDEYHKYNSEGAEALDEASFWTFPIDDKENEQRRICGNIYENKHLLEL